MSAVWGRAAQHADYEQIARLVPEGSRVLDLGCGNGQLLKMLMERKGVTGRGVDIDEENVVECIRKGLSVFQGNLDEGLADYQDKSYDYVILNRTLQVVLKPDYVIREMLRIGDRAIVSFPNFGHWKVRLSLLLKGRMPVTRMLPFEWYNTPNIHLVTIKDFKRFCLVNGIDILNEVSLVNSRRVYDRRHRLFPNLLAEEGIFVIASRTEVR
jgi:methionine biosynthesis protein MetW